MMYAIAYIAVLVVFVAMDAAWLTIMGSLVYRPTLADILLADLKVAPAIVFYLLYPVGLVVFAAGPALKAETVMPALMFGALFGFIAYGTYDLTNFATLRNWTLQITVLDMAWGAFTSATASALSYWITKTIMGWSA